MIQNYSHVVLVKTALLCCTAAAAAQQQVARYECTTHVLLAALPNPKADPE
jgi:hypothetical protein